MNKVSSALVLFSIASMALTSVVKAEEYVEPGRHGFQLSVTEDTVFGGYTYKSNHFDALFNFSGHSYGSGNQPFSYPINAHAGYRINIGDHNYIATGLAVNFVLFGKDYGNGAGNQLVLPNNPSAHGVSLFGMGRYGNYVSLQRHFPHSNLMIELWTMPYAYQLNIMNANGQKVVSHDNRYFESGAVGIAYLFGPSGDDIAKD